MRTNAKIIILSLLVSAGFLLSISFTEIRANYLYLAALGLSSFLILISGLYFLQKKIYLSSHKITSKKPLSLLDQNYLSSVAHYDKLTALPNGVVFNEILNKTVNRASRHEKLLALLLIDIDGFDNVNIILNNKSDAILKELGKRFQMTLRKDDILAKLDGSEFIVLLNDIPKAKFASTVAEKLLNACSQAIHAGHQDFFLTASIGICIFPNDGSSLEELLKHLNTALYEVKHAGGGAYQFYTEEMNAEAHEFIQLESALRKAIEHNELILYYQPKLDLKNGTINGVEALLRWEHPTLGVIYPDQFLPIAEETGLIMQIGEWALREACKANKHWQDEGYEHISVAINLSPKQFAHPDLIKTIKKILTDTDLNPNYLELEINEHTIMQDTTTADNILKELSQLGVRLTLDHFGTGYTSITYLKQFPISSLKMDKTFIKGLPNSIDNAAICSAFIGLAHNLSLSITAEGVETAEQVQFLAEHDCDMVQGYFLSYPLPASKIVLQFKKISEHVFQPY